MATFLGGRYAKFVGGFGDEKFKRCDGKNLVTKNKIFGGEVAKYFGWVGKNLGGCVGNFLMGWGGKIIYWGCK